jgi:hypothetical protein
VTVSDWNAKTFFRASNARKIMSPIRGLISEYKSLEAKHKALFSFIFVAGALAICGM